MAEAWQQEVAHFSGKSKWKLEDFDLQQTIAVGTFGRVRLVNIKGKEQKLFVLKIVKKHEAVRLGQAANITKEALMLSIVNSPWFVNSLARFQDDTRLYTVMEYVNGGDLQGHIQKHGVLSDADARFYAAEVGLAISHLHGMTIVYRDLRPENVLLTWDGHVKIADLGFAKVLGGNITYTLCGTPEYMAPEVLQSKGHGLCVDWWSFGAFVFEMLNGESPFHADELVKVYEKVLEAKIQPKKSMTRHAKDLVRALLRKEIKKRLGVKSGGASEVLTHRWFKDFDWTGLVTRELSPPFLPDVQSQNDRTMFERYPDSTEKSAMPILEHEQDKFADFTLSLEPAEDTIFSPAANSVLWRRLSGAMSPTGSMSPGTMSPASSQAMSPTSSIAPSEMSDPDV